MGLFSKISSTVSKAKGVIGSVRSEVSSIERALGSAGQSYKSISSMIDRIDDSILNKGDKGFFTGDSVSVGRATVEQIEKSRDATSMNPGKYSAEVSPETKIPENNVGKDIQFPPDMGEYYMSFTFMDYERPNIFQEAKVQNPYTIFLPVAQQLLEQHVTGWRDSEQGVLGNAATQIAAIMKGEGDMSSLTGLAGGTLYNASGKIMGGLAGAADQITGGFLDIRPDVAVDVFNQYIGAIPNPSLALIFMGPSLREFGFTWRFHPQSAKESDTITTIVNEFRKAQLPNLKFKDALNVIGYPKLVEVKLYPDKHLYQMKRCAIQQMVVNYAPNGEPQFFAGTKAPTYIELTVYLKEVEYFLAEDFGGKSGDSVLSELMDLSGEVKSITAGDIPAGEGQ